MRIALYQAQTGIDPAANADALARQVAAAAAGGAAMLFTPEMSGLLDRDRERAAAHLHEEGDDPVLAAVREAAARAGIWVHLGSLALKGAPGGKLVNRGFVIDGAGAIRARYDKIHLFDVDLPTGESWRESANYRGGEHAVLVDTPLGPLGLSICYDLRFADLYAALSNEGATAFSIPAAFTVPTGEAHWHVLLRARAIEAAAFVIAAAQVGRHEDGRSTYGHSLVVDPWGKLLLDMGGEAQGLGFAELDPGAVEEVRARLPAIHHRRPIPAPEHVRQIIGSPCPPDTARQRGALPTR
jgi:predicted amidohydrolase